MSGDIAQLARAPALQAGGPGFESPCLHQCLNLSLDRFGHWWKLPDLENPDFYEVKGGSA